jgi:hypothetical protein
LYTNVHSWFTQNFEVNLVFISRWMDKQIFEYLCNEMLQGNWKDRTTNT